MVKIVSEKPVVIVFEIQSPDSEKYASPYVVGVGNKAESIKNSIFEFLNRRNINFVIKEGTDITQLTSTTTMTAKNFFRAYGQGEIGGGGFQARLGSALRVR